jgi:Ran GTPase-activating protein (RanGAP) involved in mRNA processing and transport
MAKLSEALYHTGLQELDLSQNEIGYNGVKSLSNYVGTGHSKLVTLNLTNVKMTS